MPFKFSSEQYADIIYCYGKCHENSEAAVREYSMRFPDKRLPNSRVFPDSFQRLRETGSIKLNNSE